MGLALLMASEKGGREQMGEVMVMDYKGRKFEICKFRDCLLWVNGEPAGSSNVCTKKRNQWRTHGMTKMTGN